MSDDDEEQLAALLQEKKLLTQAQKANVIHGQSLTKAIGVLRKAYLELKSVLSALDMADSMDAEDQASLEVIRTAQRADIEAAQTPIPASIVTDIPLLRLQTIECAEFDDMLVSRPWTSAEDAQLKQAIRAAAQKSHFKALIATPQPDVTQAHTRVSGMTEEQALQLADQIDSSDASQDDLDWDMVTIALPTRNVDEIQTRWRGVLRPSVNSTSWTQDEITRLITIVQPYLTSYVASIAPVPWSKVAEELGTHRTPYACFVQTSSYLVKRDQPDSTPEEDEAIKTLFNLFRGSWRMMSLHHTCTPNLTLPDSANASERPATILGKVHRDPTHIYRQYRNRLDPALARGKWTQHEDQLLIQAVQEVGQDRWTSTAARVPGRTSSQCRERWQRRLKRQVALQSHATDSAPALRLQWTAQLDSELDKCIDQHLNTKDGLTWVQVAAQLSDKTGMQLTDKRVRDRIATYKKWLKRTGSRDPALNKRSSSQQDDTTARKRTA